MPYYLIDNQPVFLTSLKYKALEDMISKDRDVTWKVVSMMQDSKESIEKSQLMYKVLSEQYKSDPKKFQLEWIEFDMEGIEAQENVWDLLYDFSTYYGNSFLSDKRDFTEQFIAEYEHEALLYPMGKSFYINFLVLPTKANFLNYLIRKKSSLQMEINVKLIQRLTGTLKNFTIISDSFKITCNKNIVLDFVST